MNIIKVVLYCSKCAEVCEPREGFTTNWPANTEGRCFVVCSPNRAYYIVAESEEDKKLVNYIIPLCPSLLATQRLDREIEWS